MHRRICMMRCKRIANVHSKRFLPALFAMAITFTPSLSSPIDYHKARQIASKYLLLDEEIQTSKKVKAERATNRPYYIFSGTRDRGFVIVSGDDRANEIIGWSPTYTLNNSTMPPALQSALKAYAERVSNGEYRADKAFSTKPTVIVPSYIPTKWNQSYPYNYFCASYTGCVPTAMAQTMYYYKWPHKRPVSFGYSTDGRTDTTKTIETYDWDTMYQQYDHGQDRPEQEVIESVAILMRDAGKMARSLYTRSATITYDQSMVYAMKSDFDYHLEAYSRNHYPDSLFQAVLHKAIDERKAIIVTGGVHAFMFDGYDSNGFVSVNWGWGGASDGFYDINVLCPTTWGDGAGGYNATYNTNLMLYVATPNDSTHEVNEGELRLAIGYAGSFTAEPSDSISMSQPADEALNVYFSKLSNFTARYFEGRIGVGVFDDRGTLVRTDSLDRIDRINLMGSLSVGTPIKVNFADLPTGVYTLSLMTRFYKEQKPKEAWTTIVNPIAIKVERTAERIRVIAQDTLYALSLVGRADISGTLYCYGDANKTNSTGSIVAQIHSDSPTHLEGHINIEFTPIAGGSTTIVSVPRKVIFAGQTERFNLLFTTPDLPTGRYRVTLKFVTDYTPSRTVEVSLGEEELIAEVRNLSDTPATPYIQCFDITTYADGTETTTEEIDMSMTQSVELLTRFRNRSGSAYTSIIAFSLRDCESGKMVEGATLPISITANKANVNEYRLTLPLNKALLEDAHRYAIVPIDTQSGLEIWTPEKQAERTCIIVKNNALTNIAEVQEQSKHKNTYIYNVYGQKMNGDVQSLPSGIYIIGGKKVLKQQ